jgi:hypothetical protein
MVRDFEDEEPEKMAKIIESEKEGAGEDEKLPRVRA